MGCPFWRRWFNKSFGIWWLRFFSPSDLPIGFLRILWWIGWETPVAILCVENSLYQDDIFWTIEFPILFFSLLVIISFDSPMPFRVIYSNKDFFTTVTREAEAITASDCKAWISTGIHNVLASIHVLSEDVLYIFTFFPWRPTCV